MLNKCIYCGELATTRDHLPPLGLFLKPYPKNLITVPCCFKCNNSYSEDENYTRLVFSSSRSILQNNDLGIKLWDQKARRSLSKNHKLTFDIYKSFRPVNLYYGKIYLGRVPGYKPDMNKIERVVEKIIRGLFYLETKSILNKNANVIIKMKPSWGKDADTQKVLSIILKSPVVVLGNGVLMYSAAFCDNSIENSVWILRFLNNDNLTFACFTRLDEVA